MFNPEKFIHLLKKVDEELLFNQYTQSCSIKESFFKKPKLFPQIRTKNLKILMSNMKKFDTILVGEAPGPWGARRTGLAFTDQQNLVVASTYWSKKINSLFFNLPFNEAIKENSAQAVWEVLRQLHNPPALWNIIPFHPFNKDNELSIRTPNTEDFQACQEVIEYFFTQLDFKQIYAVGRKSEEKLNDMGIDNTYIRHPSHGGQNKFKEFILEEFETREGFYKRNKRRFV